MSDNNAKTATFCQALFRFAQIGFASRGRRKIPTLSRAKLNIQNFFKRNSAQCIERLLQGSCHAAAGHLANGRFGPFTPSRWPANHGFVKVAICAQPTLVRSAA
ncbi:hypothetical protein [Celeribacter halophilus]|uniref:hypothetical protein n=1 Tax=Celeribacter halophilus TaxID=576117 RepID=UPI003A95A0AE